MLVSTQTLLVFVPAALALNLTPGNDMMFCLGQGIKSGPNAGIAASFGIATGAMIHTFLAGLGLAGLVSTYPMTLEILRWAGVAYLGWIAFKAFFCHRPDRRNMAWAKNTTIGVAWRNGVLVNLLNPKIVIFVLAFIPQFVDPARGSVLLQFLVFGLILNTGGTIINCLVGGYAGKLGAILTRSLRTTRIFEIISGCIFLLLAARLAVTSR